MGPRMREETGGGGVFMGGWDRGRGILGKGEGGARGGGMGFCMREGNAGMEGWVAACVFARGGMGCRVREDTEGGVGFFMEGW